MYKMKTVKEWAEESGIRLANYDGYTTAYEIVSEKEGKSFIESQAIRFRDAGYLYCTRKAFLSGIDGCTMYFPKIDDFDKISEILPEYAERNIWTHISLLKYKIEDNKNDKDQLKELLQQLVELINKKKDYRNKSIKINGNQQTVIEEIHGNDNKKEKERLYANKYNQTTIEGLEECLLDNITSTLETELKNKRIKERCVNEVFKEISLLGSLSDQASRNQG